MLHLASSWTSLIASSVLGIVCAVGYWALFNRFTARALKSLHSFNPAWTLSGLFFRLTLAGLAVYFISRTPAVNLLVVLITFVIMVSILVVWIARDFSRQLVHHK